MTQVVYKTSIQLQPTCVPSLKYRIKSLHNSCYIKTHQQKIYRTGNFQKDILSPLS